jgi:hypothetical protein
MKWNSSMVCFYRTLLLCLFDHISGYLWMIRTDIVYFLFFLLLNLVVLQDNSATESCISYFFFNVCWSWKNSNLIGSISFSAGGWLCAVYRWMVKSLSFCNMVMAFAIFTQKVTRCSEPMRRENLVPDKWLATFVTLILMIKRGEIGVN